MFRSLQMARGIAALAVTLFHTSGMFADPRYGFARPFWSVAERGDLGVDFFFVLSGFIIMTAHREHIGQRRLAGDYAFKRFARIFPMYWLFTVLVVLGAVLTGGITVLPTRFADVGSVMTLVRFTDVATPLSVAWTLFHELLFYAFFGLLILNRQLGIAAMALWFGTVAVNFYYPPFGEWSFLNTLLSAHNLSFLLGIGAYFLAGRLNEKIGWTALLCGLALFALVYTNEQMSGRADLLQLGFSISFAAIIAGMVAVERAGRMRQSTFLLAIGNASYTLYLCHENVGATALKVAVHTGLVEMVDHRLLFFGIVIGIVGCSLLVYRYIEQPLLHWSRARYLTAKTRYLGAKPAWAKREPPASAAQE